MINTLDRKKVEREKFKSGQSKIKMLIEAQNGFEVIGFDGRIDNTLTKQGVT